jgi:hypothetical protein
MEMMQSSKCFGGGNRRTRKNAHTCHKSITPKVISTSMKNSKIPKGKSKIKGQTTIYKTQNPLQTLFVNIAKCQSFYENAYNSK